MLFRLPFNAMGSGCELLVRGGRAEAVKHAAEAAVKEIKRLEAKYSRFQPDSLLSQLNAQAAEGWVEVDGETAHLLATINTWHQATGGLFDPTLGAVQPLWRFAEGRRPTPDQLAAALPLVGWHQVAIEPLPPTADDPRPRAQVRFAQAGMQLDFGGLVKEYAADAAKGVLQVMGVHRGLVNLGGDIAAVGRVAEGEAPWHVGVADPRDLRAPLATLALRHGAVVTSGDYQRFFMADGVRYHHLLDPATGQPLALPYGGVTAHGATATQAAFRASQVLLAPPSTAGDLPQALRQGGLLMAVPPEGQPFLAGENEACWVVRQN